MSCSNSTPVKVLKPGDLDGAQSPEKENSESLGKRTSKNGGRCLVLSRVFNCGSKAKKTRVISRSPAISSVDGAHCNPD